MTLDDEEFDELASLDWLDSVNDARLFELALECEGSLYRYLQLAWPAFDPAVFVGGWHLEAIAEHLEAVSSGQIRKLLINIRPRSCKTGIVSVAWPTWTWAQSPDVRFPLRGPSVRFLCGSYGANKAKEDGVTARRLIGSEWYQRLWGGRVRIAEDRDNQERYDTLAGGSRINTGIPESLGKGGVIRILDDPHKTDEVESDIMRESVLRGYREIWSTRENDPASGAEVIIMQRQAENDLSGWLLETSREWVHLCIPAWHEDDRRCSTYVQGKRFWTDPREEDGTSFWPQRYPETHRRIDEALGPYAFAGQIQQRPEPRGGGVIRAGWWQRWPPEGEEAGWISQVVLEDGRTVNRLDLPDFDFTLASVDGAYTLDDSNDYCACTVWGMFTYRSRPGIMLIEAWRERLELHPFVQRIIATCRKRQVGRLLIENKASGRSAAQEVRRLMRAEEWSIDLIEPKGDKMARLLSVQPLFSSGIIYAPHKEPGGYRWVNMVIDEVGSFPKAAHDDLVDCSSQALHWLRKSGAALLANEMESEVYDALLFRGNAPTVAQAYGVG